ncbi:unnamed protein product [Prorocentrum cordatum]|uniref:Uncharacterized protein n=1 Tax=Prorocentrum cordatum TaxID=2364126 RepID=A0ABN9T310_9DINO|nr:unnamed protein product [Polarella glacialis]
MLNGTRLLLKARFGVFLADFEAHVNAFSFKGAAGSVPCPRCRNVVGRCEHFDDSPDVLHIWSPSYEKIQPRTNAELKDIVDHLSGLAAAGANAELKLDSQHLGVRYDPDALLWDRELIEITKPPSCLYLDWMHCLAASGGIGQFVLNRVLRALLEASAEFTLEVLDEWAKCAKLPRSHQQLPKMFFQERYVKGVNKHIRAFASEVLSATVVLTMFMEEVVEDDDEVLSDHLLILKMQCAIFDALERGDPEDARSTIEAYYEYAKLYARLYPECRKPKLHFTLHALQSWLAGLRAAHAPAARPRAALGAPGKERAAAARAASAGRAAADAAATQAICAARAAALRPSSAPPAAERLAALRAREHHRGSGPPAHRAPGSAASLLRDAAGWAGHALQAALGAHGGGHSRGAGGRSSGGHAGHGMAMSCGQGVPFCGVLSLESGLGPGKYLHDEPAVHGLWPQTDHFGSSQCRLPSSKAPPEQVHACYRQAGQSPQELLSFQRHEWSNHGMCSGAADEADYFSQVCDLAAAPLSIMAEVRRRGGGLDAMSVGLQDAGYEVWGRSDGTSEVRLSACAGSDGRWTLAPVRDFARRCGASSLRGAGAAAPAGSAERPAAAEGEAPATSGAIAAEPARHLEHRPEPAAQEEASPRCVLGRRGPPCAADDACAALGGCLRCARSGHCTAEPLGR